MDCAEARRLGRGWTDLLEGPRPPVEGSVYAGRKGFLLATKVGTVNTGSPSAKGSFSRPLGGSEEIRTFSR